MPEHPTTRMTRQRQVILEELQALKSHPTADELYELVRRRLPHISLGTVYRNLDVLAERGVIRKLRLGCAQARFDGDTSTHYHVRCVECGRVDDLPLKPLRAIERACRSIPDYELLGYRLEFTGVCSHCGRSGAPPRSGRARLTAACPKKGKPTDGAR
jgi:Fur family ferric uptake transcriptional regulator